MREKKLCSGRGDIYYWISEHTAGEVEAIFFLPGLTANHHLFDFQVEHFSGQHRVLTWDAPGHGKSRPYSEFTYPNLAEEVKGILDREGIERVVLVGQSAGGFVAQSFVARYPSMVKGMALIGTCPYGPEYYSRSDLFWLRQTEWMARLFPDNLLRNIMAGMCGITDVGRENMLHMLADYEKGELCHLMYLGFAGFIPEIRKLNITCPVCLIVGEKDRTGKVKRYNTLWHEREKFPLHIVRGAAHNANVDRPDEVNGIIEAFLGSCW